MSTSPPTSTTTCPSPAGRVETVIWSSDSPRRTAAPEVSCVCCIGGTVRAAGSHCHSERDPCGPRLKAARRAVPEGRWEHSAQLVVAVVGAPRVPGPAEQLEQRDGDAAAGPERLPRLAEREHGADGPQHLD